MSYVKVEKRRKNRLYEYAIVPVTGGRDLLVTDDEFEAAQVAGLMNLAYHRGVEAGRSEHASELRALLNEGL